MSEHKALTALKLGMIFCTGLALGVASHGFETPERSCTEIDQKIDQKIDVYVEYMARAGELRGRMPVVDFQKYHSLKREYARRCAYQ